MVFTFLHIIHLLTVIIWIGGLAFVTTLVLPAAIKTEDPLQKVLQFQRIEHRFAPLARVYCAVTGITGFAMIFIMGWHKMIFTQEGAALLIMTAVWVFWAVMLFGLEPIIIKRMLDRMAKKDPNLDIDSIFSKMNKLHWMMLFVSLVASGAGVVFAHGYL